MNPRPQLRALPGLLLVMILVPLDQTAVVPALPEIAGELGGVRQMPLVVTAYVGAVTAALPVYGKLGDRFGRKPVLLTALTLFVVGALACTLAPGFAFFVAARVLQGLGGGGLMVGAQATVGDLISPRERGRYLGLFGAVYVIPAVAGPLVGGLLVDMFSWRWIFALPVLVGIVAFALLVVTLRLPRPTASPPIDVVGSAALAVAVLGVVVIANSLGESTAVPGEQSRWLVPALGAGAAVALVIWLVSTRLATDPVLPLHLLRRRGVLIPMLLSFTVGFALFGTVSYVPTFARIGLGMTAVQAGFAVTATMGGAIVTMSLSGRRIARHGYYRRYPIMGTALMALGSVVLGALGPRIGIPGLLATLFAIGLGVGLVMQVMMLAAQNAAGPDELGAATSGVLFLRQVGASVGTALVGSLVMRALVAQIPPEIGETASIAPEEIAALPPAVREVVGEAVAEAVPNAILTVTPLLAIAFLLALILPALPLRTWQETESVEETP